jgi:hypothetical protein
VSQRSRTSTSPSGTARAGRRAQGRVAAAEKPFLQRYQTPIVLFAVAALAVGVVAFVFVQANSSLYACTNLWQPTAAETSPDRLGGAQPDMGNAHVGNGDFVRFANCPPASGKHWNVPGGPITPRYYAPGDTTYPQGWVHNLEHGALVVLYSCDKGGCEQADLDKLFALAQDFPTSPICDIPGGFISPVITRFEEIATPFAALVWDRALLQQTLDIEEIKAFFAEEAERTNPELQCPRPSPSPEPSPSASPGASPSPSPAAS